MSQFDAVNNGARFGNVNTSKNYETNATWRAPKRPADTKTAGVFDRSRIASTNTAKMTGLSQGNGAPSTGYQARRTDNDRKPAKPVIRANDYAPTLEQREAESARRLAAINAKREEAQRIYVERLNMPKTHLRESDMANAERTRENGLRTEIQVLQIINNGCSLLKEIRAYSQTSEGNVRRVARKLEARGLIIIDLELAPENCNGTKRHRYSITQIGKQFLAGQDEA